MSVREAVYALVDRVASGAAFDDAAEGLVLEWDEHGNHATDFLCLPGVWQKLDERRLCELVDWFLARGADGGHLLERTLSDGLYGAGDNPIRGHLLARTPLPDLRRALVGAFRRRRLALARDLVARGADVGALADWVEVDLVTPATIDVRYQPSEAEQIVSLSVTLRRLQPDYGGEATAPTNLPRAFVRLGERGLLGGDAFPPGTSRVTEQSIESRAVGRDTEVLLTLRVRGVAPSGLALVFRSFVGRELHWYPRAILLAGDVPPAGDALTVDSARARSWFQDVASDPYEPPRSVPFAVTAKPRKSTFAVVEHHDGLWRDVHRLGQAIDPEQLGARSLGFDVDDRSRASVHFDSKNGGTKTEIVLKKFGAGEAPDPAPLRAAFLHGLCALDGVTSVRWCDDAGAAALLGARGDEPAAKPAGKPKRAKPVAVQHPDRGPSRVPTLRAAIEGRELPWAAVGAVATTIPETFGGAPLPPTLRAWLAAGDATWPLSKDRPFALRSFADLLRASHGEMADVLAPLGEHLLAGECVPLFVPSTCADGTVLFLHLPLADGEGEAPVLGFDPTDEGLVGVFAPRFDHYLARVLWVDDAPTTFAAGPLTDPYLSALVGRLPARRRSHVPPRHGMIAVGPLLEG